ncbi:MAG TPA: NUDIX domain-containing protein, partial [Arthrobacter sp.]|nr:NUDIX domain-containing protein [Arthrobacter sp.]
MTAADQPPPRTGPRDPGDAWVEGPDGTRMWGRFGSAGLLAFDPGRGILLQHRAVWSHFGGTWGIPGGARHQGEAAVDAALRESHEEAGVPVEALAPLFSRVRDLDFWSYTTVAAHTVHPFEPSMNDAESLDLAWVPLADVEHLPLHPHFAEDWPLLRWLLEHPPVLIVDAANVVGSRPNGWWRDRAGAAARLLLSLASAADDGFPADLLDTDAGSVWPRTVVVLEGAAKAAAPAGPYASDSDGASAGASASRGRNRDPLQIVHATGSGDDEIVSQVEAFLAEDPDAPVTVVTSDRGLRTRIAALGARAVGAGS